MAEGANDTPAASGRSDRHGQGAKTDYPFGQYENRRLQKIQPARQMIEAACFCAGEQRERNDAHCFLRVICSVTMRHPCRAEDLQFPKERMNQARRETMQRDKK